MDISAVADQIHSLTKKIDYLFDVVHADAMSAAAATPGSNVSYVQQLVAQSRGRWVEFSNAVTPFTFCHGDADKLYAWANVWECMGRDVSEQSYQISDANFGTDEHWSGMARDAFMQKASAQHDELGEVKSWAKQVADALRLIADALQNLTFTILYGLDAVAIAIIMAIPLLGGAYQLIWALVGLLFGVENAIHEFQVKLLSAKEAMEHAVQKLQSVSTMLPTVWPNFVVQF